MTNPLILKTYSKTLTHTPPPTLRDQNAHVANVVAGRMEEIKNAYTHTRIKMPKDYYKTLGVEKNASKDEIKQAFRKLAHEYHPDKKGGNEAKFKEANEAYSTLSDDAKRAQYDRFGSAGPGSGGSGASAGGYARGGNPFGGQGGGFDGFDFSQFTQGFGGGNGGQNVEFDIGDIFGDIFGGGGGFGGSTGRGGQGGRGRAQKGRDMSIDIEVPFRDSVFGSTTTLRFNRTAACDHCKGTGGEPGTEIKTCDTCRGQGKVQEVRRTFLGNVSTTATCPTCAGKGTIPKEKCKVCRGAGVHDKQENLEVVIPAGINDGEMLRMTGKGETVSGASGSASIPGDLYVKIHVVPHPLFQREGSDLHSTLAVKLSEALLGAIRTFATLDGDIQLSIPAGIVHGEQLRVKGRGVPIGNSKNRRGDLFVKVGVEMPKNLSKAAKKAIEELKKEGM
ncbi:MAG: DnaJ C-terminal domain-containing protein [bacterium]